MSNRPSIQNENSPSMKWLSFLSKPAWESADPAKRAAAVAEESHPDLLGKIPDFARHDADALVRKAAVRRLDDLSLLADRARLDASAEVRDLARQRLRHFLLDTKVSIEQRQRQVLVTEDTEILEAVATQAPETDLRRAAMERVQRMGLIIDRCLKDPDPKLRHELLNRIEDSAALERVAEAARKSDKQLARLAKERLNAARLKSGDAVAIRQRAEAICMELEAFLRQRPEDLSARLQTTHSEWQTLQPAPEESLSRRYQGLTETLRHMLEAASRPAEVAPPEPEPATPEPVIVAAIEVAIEVVDAEDPALLQSVSEFETLSGIGAPTLERHQQAFRSLLAAAPRCPSNESLRQRFETHTQQIRQELQQREQHAEKNRAAAHAAVTDYAHAIESGRLAEARAARQRAHQLNSALATSDRDHKRLEQTDAAFDKLARWQRWSNDTQRKRICDEIEAVLGSGEHPDALLTRIKNAQAEWARLDESEREPGQAEAAPGGLTKRFRMLCAKAIAPARPYLEKRSALRTQKREEVVAVLTAIEEAIAATDQSVDAFELRSQTIEALRRLDEVAPQERRKLSERLRAAKETLDTRINDARAQAEAEKRKFIAQLKRRVTQAESADAINAAKDAMARWKTLPRGDRKTEDVLWAELRAVVDPVFDRSKAEKVELDNAQAAERAAVTELIAEAQALAESDHEAHALETRLAALQQRWRALANRSRDDERGFDKQVEAVEARRRSKLQAGEQRSRDEAMRLRAAVVAVSDNAAYAALRSEIETAGLAGTDRTALLAHIAGLQSGAEVDADESIAALQQDAVLAELLAGIDSPADQQSLRKQVQIQRLAEKMSGGSGNGGDEARALWLRWLTCSGIVATARAALDARIETALRRLFDKT
jgi:DNA repair protein SbcC/Rad50